MRVDGAVGLLVGCSGPEMMEVVVQIWVDVVEGVEIKYVDALTFVDH